MQLIYSCKWLILKILLSELGPQHPYLFTFHFHNLSLPCVAAFAPRLLALLPSILPVQDEARDIPCRAVPCAPALHATRFSHHGSAVGASSTGPCPSWPPAPVQPGHSRCRCRGHILLARATHYALFIRQHFSLCNSISQAAVLLIQWCLIFYFLKYHKWMGRKHEDDPLYMSSNTHFNV